MKLKKIIPLAMALAFITPAFAAESASSPLSLTVPTFFNVTADTTHVTETAVVDYEAGEHGTINVPNLYIAFDVTTNVPNDRVVLQATAKENNAETPSLYGTTDALKLIFTNVGSGTGTGAESGTIGNMITGDATAGGSVSPNAISFALTKTITPSGAATTQPGAAVDTDGSGKKVIYTLHNGMYNMKYQVGAAYGESFDTYDTAGLYRATVTLTHLGPA